MKTYSQFKIEVPLTDLLEKIDFKNKVCCEFGAANGVRISNTRFLILHHGWKGIMIESNPSLAKQIESNYDGYDVKAINSHVTVENINTLIPGDVDILSIDVDRNDYYLFEALDELPCVVIIEFNKNKDPNFIPSYSAEWAKSRKGNKDPIGKGEMGSGLGAIKEMAEKKGYVFHCTDNGVNAIFIRKDAYDSYII